MAETEIFHHGEFTAFCRRQKLSLADKCHVRELVANACVLGPANETHTRIAACVLALALRDIDHRMSITNTITLTPFNPIHSVRLSRQPRRNFKLIIDMFVPMDALVTDAESMPDNWLSEYQTMMLMV